MIFPPVSSLEYSENSKAKGETEPRFPEERSLFGTAGKIVVGPSKAARFKRESKRCSVARSTTDRSRVDGEISPLL